MKTASEYAGELKAKIDGYHEAYIGSDELATDNDDLQIGRIIETSISEAQNEVRSAFNAAWGWANENEFSEDALHNLTQWWEGEPEAMAAVDAWVLAKKRLHIYDLQMKTIVTQVGSGSRITTLEGDIEKVKATWKRKLEPNSILLSIMEVTE